jgi:hypothetical protein
MDLEVLVVDRMVGLDDFIRQCDIAGHNTLHSPPDHPLGGVDYREETLLEMVQLVVKLSVVIGHPNRPVM